MPLYGSPYRRGRRQPGFTLVELLVAIGIIGVIASVTVAAIGPRSMLIKAKDASRSFHVNQLEKALTQFEIAAEELESLPQYPTESGTGSAVPICKYSVTRDTACVNLNDIVDGGIISSLPEDSTEPCVAYTGYELYRNDEFPAVFATHQGKTTGDTLERHCLLDTLAPDILNVQYSLYASTASITWETDEGADGQVEYGTTTSYGNRSTLNPVIQTSHNELLSGLLPYTLYHFRVLSRDPAGNIYRSGDYTFTTGDTVTPVFVGTPSASVTETEATITWTTDEPADTQVRYGATNAYGQTSTLITTMSTSHTAQITGLTPGTTYHYSTLSRDASGNLAQSLDYTFTTLPDLTPPVVSGVSTSVEGNNLTVTWTTNEPSTSQVQYGTSASYGSQTTLDSTLTTSHSVTIANLTINTLYHYNILSDDAAGNTGASGNRTVNVIDETSPIISAIAATSLTYSGAVITWSTNEGATAQVEYGTTVSYGNATTLNTNFLTSHSRAITGLMFDTTYHYRIINRDSTGNVVTSDDQTFTTASPISAVSITGLSAVGATVNWTTAIAMDTQVQYGTTQAMVSNTALDTVMRTTGHTRSITGLSANTLYYYRIKSRDTFGNLAIRDGTFTTSPDTTAPGISAVSITNLTTTSPTITWNTNEAADTQVEYGLTNAYGSTTTLNTTMIVNGHSATISGLSMNTTYYYRLRSRDAAGNLGTTTGTFYTDNVAPVLTLPPSVTGVTGNVATINWTSNESAQAQVDWGVTTSYTSATAYSGYSTVQSRLLTGLSPNTTYYYRVRSKDAAGNITASGAYTFSTNADTTPPVISAVSITNLTTTSPTITWNTNEAADTQVEYGLTNAYGSTTTLNTTMIVNGHSATISGLSMNTTYYYRLRSRDAAGNLGTTTGTFYTDNVAPVLTLPPTISGYTGVAATINWTSNESAQAQVDYGLTTSYGSTTAYSGYSTVQNRQLTGLSATSVYNYRVRTRDIAGNITVSGNYILDGTPPTITSVASSGVGDTTATITWTTNETSDTQVEYGTSPSYGSSTTVNASLVTSHSQSLTSLIPNTQYHYRVKSRDSSGNLQTSANYTFTTTDTTAPTFSAIDADVTSDSAATITWTTNEASSTQVEYGTTTTYGSTTTLNTDLVSSHSQSLSGLSPNTTYHYRVKSRDAAGNLGTSGDGTFTTTDTTGPVITAILANNITSTTATVSWTTNENADTQIEYGTTTSYGNTTALNGTLSTSHSQSMSGLLPSTLYHYRVKSRDAAGNLTNSADQTLTTAGDTTPPTISAVASTTNSTAISVTITWTTNEASTTQIEYGTTTGYGTETTLVTSLVTSHSQTITGLTPNTQYHYRVRSKDAANNEAVSANYTFTIVDTTAPTITAGPTVPAVTATTATVQWTTNENASTHVEWGLTTSYDAYNIDATLVTSHSYTITGLLPDTTYQYRVKSRDAAGNQVTSANGNFRTDGTPPTINGVTVSSITSNSAVVSWTTNESATSAVEYGPTTSYGSTASSATRVVTHNLTLTNLSPNTLYNYRVLSTDAAQNQATTTNATFTTAP